MARLQLKNGGTALIDDIDVERVSQFNWSSFESRNTTYVRNRSKRIGCPVLHRFILGITDDSVIVDHANGDGLDNRRSNLRVCSNQENCSNQRIRTQHNGKPKSSRFKGVTLMNKRFHHVWMSQIGVKGKIKRLGTYVTEEEAATAYDIAAMFYFGDFAQTNTQKFGPLVTDAQFACRLDAGQMTEADLTRRRKRGPQKGYKFKVDQDGKRIKWTA
jgi:hypothetical protein